MELEPLHDWILLELDEVPDTTKAGLHLPDSAPQKKQVMKRATVLKVGPGKLLDGPLPELMEEDWLVEHACQPRMVIMDLAPGDRVLLKPNPGALCPEGLPRDDQRRFVKYDSIVSKISAEEHLMVAPVNEAIP